MMAEPRSDLRGGGAGGEVGEEVGEVREEMGEVGK